MVSVDSKHHVYVDVAGSGRGMSLCRRCISVPLLSLFSVIIIISRTVSRELHARETAKLHQIANSHKSQLITRLKPLFPFKRIVKNK